MRLQDFKDGKISVWAETKADAERFLRACEAAGLEKISAIPEHGKTSYVCGWMGMPTNSIGWSDKKHYAQDNAHNGKQFTCITVAEFFGEQKRNEQVIAYYNPDGTVTCIHKKDGKVVQRETVKRYYKDADDLRVAAKHALEKMLVDQKQEKPETLEYHPGDKVLVRDDLVVGRIYGCKSFKREMDPCCGKVITLSEQHPVDGDFRVKENDWWFSPEMLVGKIVPLGGLKAGDEVLVKGAEYLDCPEQKESANKVVRITGIDGAGDAWTEDACFTPNLRFVGKLIRIPAKG